MQAGVRVLALVLQAMQPRLQCDVDLEEEPRSCGHSRERGLPACFNVRVMGLPVGCRSGSDAVRAEAGTRVHVHVPVPARAAAPGNVRCDRSGAIIL